VLVSFKHHFPAAALSSDGGESDWARGITLYERATGRQAPGFGVLTVPPEAHMAVDLIEINRQQETNLQACKGRCSTVLQLLAAESGTLHTRTDRLASCPGLRE